MGRRHALCIALLLMFCGCKSSERGEPRVGLATSRPLGEQSTEALIEALTDATSEDLAAATNIISFRGPMPEGLMLMGETSGSAAMKELVRRGQPSVAALVAHLGDGRPTRGQVKGILGLSYGCAYDWNLRDRRPDGVGSAESVDLRAGIEPPAGDSRERYQIKVGDVCFRLIGEIVNRELMPVAFIPSTVVLVSSPVSQVSVRAATERDWKGLTRAQHRERLMRDVLRPDKFDRAPGGMRALVRYFPEDVPEVLRQRLAMPRTWSSASFRRLAQEGSAEARRAIVAELMARKDEAAIDQLLADVSVCQYQQVGDALEGGGGDLGGAVWRVSPAVVLRELAEQTNRYVDAEEGAAFGSLDEARVAEVVEALDGYETPAITEMLWKEFQAGVALEKREPTEAHFMADACAGQLAGGVHHAAIVAWAEAKLTEEENVYARDALRKLIDTKVRRP